MEDKIVMELLEKYEYYEKGIVKANVNESMQNFFKTKPTKDQLLLVQQILRNREAAWAMIVILMAVIGVLLGYASGYLQCLLDHVVKLTVNII